LAVAFLATGVLVAAVLPGAAFLAVVVMVVLPVRALQGRLVNRVNNLYNLLTRVNHPAKPPLSLKFFVP
jgi:hypothetical protein